MLVASICVRNRASKRKGSNELPSLVFPLDSRIPPLLTYD